MEKESISSGFVEADAVIEGQAFARLEEVYSSTSGYNRLFKGERYGKWHIIKTLQPAYCGSPLFEQALHKEFAIGYQLEHPNICRTYGWESLPQLGQCIILEYIDGTTLKELMERGGLTPVLAYKVIGELCQALSYLHSKQIVHRDLKPENILITHNGQNVKLIDFSLSDTDDYDVLKMPAGTRYYIAPEALVTGAPATLKADLYSLGVIIGEMATLLNDKRLAAISRRCTQRNPERRYASASQVAMALSARRFPAALASVIAAAVLLPVVVFGAWYAYDATESAQHPKPTIAVPQSQPAYGNCSLSQECLSEWHAIREQALHEGAMDTVRVKERLRRAFDKQFPLAVQRDTEAYRREWEQLLHSTIFSNLPQ